MQIISRPSIFALQTLFPSIGRPAPGCGDEAKKHDNDNHAPLLGQPKVLDPEHVPQLFSQSVGPFKLIEVVLNGVASDDPLVERVELQSDVRDVQGTFLAQTL